MKVYHEEGQDYRLPSDVSPFQLKMYVHLVNWKWKHITREPGPYTYKGKTYFYDTILPREYSRKEGMPHIYPSVPKYLAEHRKRNNFRIHPHFYHMASSQAANINLFLPILHHPKASDILQVVKKDFASLATDDLDNGYCLEFWGGNLGTNKHNKGPLADKSSWAGTDADIAIAYRNHQDELCLWLIEHKLREPEFTTCGGFKSKGRKDRHDCTRSFSEILKNKSICYYHDVRKFNYWEITDGNPPFFVNNPNHAECPFQGGMNQLWRNQLLGLALEKDGLYKQVYLSVVRHPDNDALTNTISAYKKLIGGNDKFCTFTSANVIDAAELNADAGLQQWITWYKELYRL